MFILRAQYFSPLKNLYCKAMNDVYETGGNVHPWNKQIVNPTVFEENYNYMMR